MPVGTATMLPSHLPSAPSVTLSPLPTYTLAPSPDATFTNILDSGLVSRCLAVEDGEIALQTIATGTIVLGRGFYGDRSLLNVQTEVEYQAPPASGDVVSYRWAISPDSNLLAIRDNLQNAEGQFERMIL